MHVQADTFEVILHDQQIKQALAQRGINVDEHWLNLFTSESEINEEACSQLCQIINRISFVQSTKANDANFPESPEDFTQLLQAFEFINEIEDENNKTYFNEALEQNPWTNTAFDNDNKFNLYDLDRAIALAICSYITKEAIEARNTTDQIHIYIKFVIDTNAQTITLFTAPNQTQDGFKTTYTQKEINNWMSKAVESYSFCKTPEVMNTKVNPTKKKSHSCCSSHCKAIILATAIAGLGITGYTFSHTDPETLQQQIDTLTELYGNFTL